MSDIPDTLCRGSPLIRNHYSMASVGAQYSMVESHIGGYLGPCLIQKYRVLRIDKDGFDVGLVVES